MLKGQISKSLLVSKSKRSVKFMSKKGFSLIELVVVIAILAILAALLAPALIHYVEDSRATSDMHSMDEVVNAVQIGLTNPDAYDEMAAVSVDGNVSCYIDSNSESNRTKDVTKVNLDGTAQYTFGDDERLLDEVPYTAAGNMRGVTITFVPNSDGELTYDLKDAVINKHIGGTSKLSDYPTLYNRVRQTIGNSITLDSNTYSNSEYTIFIKIGTTGGNEAAKQDAVQVYGQYNGTNLPKSYTSGGIAPDRDTEYVPPVNEPNNGTESSTPSSPSGSVNPPSVGGGTTGGSGNSGTISNTIPVGGVYTTADGDVYKTGDPWPTIQKGDIYTYGDYQYAYQIYWCHIDEEFDDSCYGDPGNTQGWSVSVIDRNKTKYQNMLTTINGKSVTSAVGAFYDCINMTSAPVLSDTIVNLSHAFAACESLQHVDKLPTQALYLDNTFMYCKALQQCPEIPRGVIDMFGTFQECTSITSAPVLPDTLIECGVTFSGCINLKTAPRIPQSVENLYAAFAHCYSLSGTIQIDAILSQHNNGERPFNCFISTQQPITLTGSCPYLNELAATAENGNVTVQ